MAINYQESFDSVSLGTFPHSTSNWVRHSASGTPYNYNVVNTRSRTIGGRSLRCSYTAGADKVYTGSESYTEYSNSAYRAEITSYIPGTPDNLKFSGHNWFALSYYFDNYIPPGRGDLEMIFQLHTGFGTPAIILAIRHDTLGIYRTHRHRTIYDNGVIQGQQGADEWSAFFPLCKLPVGRWFDVAIRVKQSTIDTINQLVEQDGEIDVYINKILLHTETNVRTHLNFWGSTGEFLDQNFKAGVYLSGWNSANWSSQASIRFTPGEPKCYREIYLDEIKIADGTDSINDVSPTEQLEEYTLEDVFFSQVMCDSVQWESSNGVQKISIPEDLSGLNSPSYNLGQGFADIRRINISRL